MLTIFLILWLILFFADVPNSAKFFLSRLADKFVMPEVAHAMYQYTPTSGNLVTGWDLSASLTNIKSYRGAAGNDSRYWSVTRENVVEGDSLNMQFIFDGVQEQGGNKMIITTEAGQAASTGYKWQICDWVSSTGVDTASDGDCTTGGWRTLNMRGQDFTNTTNTVTTFEIFDGYFYDRNELSPGTLISTPLSNFIDSSYNDRVLIRANSTATSVSTQIDVDQVRIEMAIDPVYEVNSITKINGYDGETSGYINDMTGTGASDGNKFYLYNTETNPLDFYTSFKNIKTYTGMNTVVIKPEVCVSSTALTFNIWLYNFSISTWEQIGSTVTGTACSSDTAYAFAKTLVSMNDYISNGEMRVRFNTETSNIEELVLDRLYIMLGSTNTDTGTCEISMGTGTAIDCVNTTTVADAEGGSLASTATWDITSEYEWPTTRWPLDDDNSTSGEYGKAANLPFPITIESGMAVTAIHWANRFRPGSGTIRETIALNFRDFASSLNIAGGWSYTVGTTNGTNLYTWSDSWQSAELQNDPEDYIDTTNNKAIIRMRTLASTNTSGGLLGNWDFAMASIRWVEEENRVTVMSQYTPTAGSLVVGTEVSPSDNNVCSYKGAVSNDNLYWSVMRESVVEGDSLNMQFIFDGVKAYGANKLIVTTEAGQPLSKNYIWQICDWVSSTGVDTVADDDCTTGGWRTINMRKRNASNTGMVIIHYELFDGYFYDRSGSTPGTLVSTPISNFITSDSNKRVLIRANSTETSSTTQFNVDQVRIEMAIDPVYEVNSITKINSYDGSISGYVTDITGTGASDGNKLTFMNTVAYPMDFYASFTNIKTYTGMNTIVVKPEVCVSNTALTFKIWIYNFSEDLWEQLGSSITGTACTVDTAYAFSTTVADMNDYISSGEMRIRFNTQASSSDQFNLDRLYIMLGSVNTETTDCEISMGSGTASDCYKTISVADQEGGSSAYTSIWNITSTMEYPNARWALDDDNATDAEYGKAANLSFPITLSPGMAVTALHWANRFRPSSAYTNETLALNFRDFGSATNATGGWSGIVGPTNGTYYYTWSDSWQSVELQTNPDDYLDTVNNKAVIRMRTSASTNTSFGTMGDWDFAMASIRWVDAGFSTTIEIRAQDYSTSVSSITFPESAPGSTVSEPYNNIDGVSSAQAFGGAGTAKPVVTLYNNNDSSLKIWYNITTFTNNLVSSEYYVINDKGAACADASCVAQSVTFDANTDSGITIAPGSDNEKDLYLKLILNEVTQQTGSSTLTILGEAQ